MSEHPRSRLSRCAQAFIVSQVLLACGGAAPTDAPQAVGVELPTLLSVEALEYDFLWQQQVTAEWPESSQSFDAALQKRDGTLQLLLLSPTGQPGMIITLRDGVVSAENRSGRELPFPPEFILADVQRVFYPWDGARSGDELAAEQAASGVAVREWHNEGVLERRTFERLDRSDEGVIDVRYLDWHIDDDAPRRAVLENGWYGYRLTIETVAQQRLPRSE